MATNFDGMTKPAPPHFAAKCPAACTADRCVISTVGVCKHPCLTGSEGCGPITMANRAEAAKFLGILPKANHADVVR